jgi:hypothetical protein
MGEKNRDGQRVNSDSKLKLAGLPMSTNRQRIRKGLLALMFVLFQYRLFHLFFSPVLAGPGAAGAAPELRSTKPALWSSTNDAMRQEAT